jgi:hypothetical protein
MGGNPYILYGISLWIGLCVMHCSECGSNGDQVIFDRKRPIVPNSALTANSLKLRLGMSREWVEMSYWLEN